MISGGKLFDEGVYGCIFTPPLECKSSTIQTLVKDEIHPPISKLIIADSAHLEFSISKMIRKIPLWKNYFVVSESICEPASIQKDKDLSKCNILDKQKLSDFRILTMPYGGTPLTTYRINMQDFNFMNFIIHFIEAGALLNLFGIVHRDIHQGNILVDENQVPRIIDFNLVIVANSEINAEDLKHTYNYTTGQEPPDSTLVNAVSLGYNYQRIIDTVIDRKPIMQKIRRILGISSELQRESLEKFYLQSKSVKKGDAVEWFHNYWRTIDSWAIGVNIVDFISKLSLWPQFSTVLRENKKTLFPVLRKLCEVSPTQRIDCVQALNHLAPSSFIIRKYGKPWLAKVGNGNI